MTHQQRKVRLVEEPVSARRTPSKPAHRSSPRRAAPRSGRSRRAGRVHDGERRDAAAVVTCRRARGCRRRAAPRSARAGDRSRYSRAPGSRAPRTAEIDDSRARGAPARSRDEATDALETMTVAAPATSAPSTTAGERLRLAVPVGVVGVRRAPRHRDAVREVSPGGDHVHDRLGRVGEEGHRAGAGVGHALRRQDRDARSERHEPRRHGRRPRRRLPGFGLRVAHFQTLALCCPPLRSGRSAAW